MSTSNSYGGYGGVSKCTKYTPPQVQDFVPQPSLQPIKEKYTPSMVQDFVPQPSLRPVIEQYIPPSIPDFIPQPATIPYTKEYREKLQILVDENGPLFNVNNILFRTRTDDLTGVTDRTFAMTTSGHPSHIITYTMPASSIAIDMLKTDGGYF
jgi:hypothetical protein